MTLNLVSDDNNTSPLGKTAHYDPSTMEVVVYVDGRHPKDIMRSFSHELVHHSQNENGMFDNDSSQGESGYAQSNPHLRKMEKQAYLEGNMCFRDWEDGYKSSNPNIFNERRIYKMSTKDWKNNELNGLLNERWGFSMDLNKLNEGSCGSHKRDDEKLEEEKCPIVKEKGALSVKKWKKRSALNVKTNLVNVKKWKEEKKDSDGDGLSDKQEKLPPGLRKAIAKKKGLDLKEQDTSEAKLREAIRKLIKKQMKK